MQNVFHLSSWHTDGFTTITDSRKRGSDTDEDQSEIGNAEKSRLHTKSLNKVGDIHVLILRGSTLLTYVSVY